MSYTSVPQFTQPISKSSSIGIIGAGPAGISIAYNLRKEGYKNITILESSSHIAGKSSTFFHENKGYDVGALMVGHNYTNIKALAAELDCPLETFTGRALDIDNNTYYVDNTDKIGIYPKLLPHLNHFLEQKQSFLDVSRPGHGQLSESELYAPITQFLKDRDMSYLMDAWSLAYTSAGYGYIQDDIPAAYFLKFIENSENTISYFKNGFQDFWAKMSENLNVVCNAKVISIDRSLKRQNIGPILVTIQMSDFNQTLAFDNIIIATNPRQTEQFLSAPTPLEKNIFSKIITFDFYTIIATVKNLPTKVGMTTIPKYCSDKRYVGHMTAYYCAYHGVPTYLFYAYGNKEIGPERVTEMFKEDIKIMGGELEEIHYNQRWDFFPHVSSLEMARGFYSQVENMQGQDGTFYVGGWLDFELTENCVSYSRDLVKRFFNLSNNPEKSTHLPIRSQIEIKPTSTLNWGMVLRLAAKRFPNKVAFTWVDVNIKEEARITYAELYKQARSVAHYLRNKAGHKVGDPILLCYAPGLKFLPILFGCMLAGIIAVPIAPPNLATAEKDIARFKYLAQTTGAKLVFSDRNYMNYTRLYAAGSFIGIGKKVDWPEDLTWVEGESVISSADLFDEILIEQVGCENVAVIQFSSGSTGDPKGIMLTHKNLLHNVDLMQNEINLDADSTIAFWVPQFHDLGLIGGFLNTIRGGCKSVVMSPLTFLQKPSSWLQMITNYQATFTAAPNFAYELVARKCPDQDIEKLDFSSLRGAFNGAEPVRWSTLKSFVKKFGPAGFKLSTFKCLYGLAEHCAYSVGFRNQHDVPTVINIDADLLREGRVKIQNEANAQENNIVSTGIPNLSMQVEVRVVDQETSQLCSPNVIGEVWVSSPSVGKGYYGKEGISKETFKAKLCNSDHGNWVTDNGSFLRTGDLGFLYNGELFITGRVSIPNFSLRVHSRDTQQDINPDFDFFFFLMSLQQKDVIIINGKNHYPQDIELTIQQCHNDIRPGCICAINHSDAETGTDSLVVLVEIRQQKTIKQETLQEICDCISRAVPGNHGLTCQRIVLLNQHSLPKTTSGKLQRSKTKDMLFDGLMDKKILISIGEKSNQVQPKKSSGRNLPLIDLQTVERKICVHVHRISKLAARKPVSEIDVQANLITTYGFDSLGAVQLTACLKEEFDIEVAPALLMDLPTISGLAGHVLKQLPSSNMICEEPISEEEFEEYEIEEVVENENVLTIKQIQEKIASHVHAISKIAAKIPKNELNFKANLITDYGFDSLAAVQLTASMKQSFGIEVAPALLYDVHTIADLSDHVMQQLNEQPKQQKRQTRVIKKRQQNIHISNSSKRKVITIEDDGKEAPIVVPLAPKNVINKHNAPLYCIHPLLGNVASYVFLAKNLGISRPVYGIQAPSDVDADIKTLARRYVRAIQLHQQTQPYYLCGYSYGGLVAWEMARILQGLGAKVGGLYLIDAPAPLQKRVRRSSLDGEEPHLLWKDDIEQLLNDVDSQWMIRSENEDPAKIEAFKKQVGTLIASMYSYTSDLTTIEAVQQFPIHYWRAKDYAGKTSKLLLDHPLFHEPNFGWEHYQGEITFHRCIPGHHYNVLREETAGRLAREFDTNMPMQTRRGSTDLKPLMLEKLATSSRGISPTTSNSMFRGSKSKSMTELVMNTQVPLPLVLHEDEIPIDPVTKLSNWDCQGAIDFESFVRTLCHLRTTGTLPPTFFSKENKNERIEVESVELNNLVTELSDRVMNLLKEFGEKKDEWSFLFVDGFLLYVDQDVINELDIKLFVKTKREILKRRREARSGYVTMEGYWEDPPNYFEDIVWPNYIQANKHILMQSGDLENDENVVSKIIDDDLIVLESDDVSMLIKNIETSVNKVLDHIVSRLN
ncbi:17371_t:CDS:2 [Funneliformis geosporum]|uniref:5944_t:CDS:1 n=1 Tax=Funneliformis geosporum TaxID=1117311 RepID=A0A9W4WJG9_9GLOM|nr:5944_t:CDS:2 [Funneliformis geosporum]CAI2167904.1 17371_t:CDS:2 [Funneliformis geosporum]